MTTPNEENIKNLFEQLTNINKFPENSPIIEMPKKEFSVETIEKLKIQIIHGILFKDKITKNQMELLSILLKSKY